MDDEGEALVESLQRALISLAGIAVALALGLSVYGIAQHIAQYRHPERQRRVVRILLMVPLYAADSFLSLCFLDAALYLDTLRDCYEAYVLYQFFLLCVSWLDGEPSVRHALSRKPDQPCFWPCCCLPPLQLSAPSYYLSLKKGILQFVVVKPFFAVIAVLMEAMGAYGNGQWRVDCFYMYHSLALNISQTVALMCLALFYSAVKEELRPWSPVWKFVCIKAVLFFAYWQGCFFAILVAMGALHNVGRYSAADLAAALQDFLTCVEMLGFAVAHLYVFGPEEYVCGEARPYAVRYALSDVFSCFDVVADTRETFDILPPAYTRLESNSELPETGILRSMRTDLRSTDLYQLGATGRTHSQQPVELDMATADPPDTQQRPRTQYGGL